MKGSRKNNKNINRLKTEDVYKKSFKEKRLEKKRENIENRILKKSGKILKSFLMILGIITISVVMFLIFFLYDKYTKLETVEIEKNEIMVNTGVETFDFGEGYLNVAIFGVDSRDGLVEKGALTDTIIVASLNNETKEVRMVSVYRDTYLNMTTGSYNKANAAYSIGGPAQAINMLNTNLDLNIEKYVTVDFSVVVDIIDILGGVELEIDEFEIKGINAYIPETARVSGVDANLITEPGLQLLDGAQATTYARIRSTTGGDFKRTDRQRYVINEMVKKIKKTNLTTLNKIVDAVLPRISTNFTVGEIALYTAAYLDFTLGANTGFPEIVSTGRVSGLGSCVIPQNLQSNVITMHEFLYDDIDYTPSTTVISNSNDIASRTSSVGGGIGNTNTQYSTHNMNNTSNQGLESDVITGMEENSEFSNIEVYFE